MIAMPAQILHTTLIRDRAVLAAGEVFQVDLPVNPISAIILTLRSLLNVVAPVAGAIVSDSLAKYSSIRVSYRGATILQGSLTDLAIAMAVRINRQIGRGQTNATNNDATSITVVLLFGRRLYDALECFPATRRGELVLEVTAAADAGTLDGHSIQAETVELLDARPQRFLKVTTISQLMSVAGVNTIELPVGNKLLGAVLRPFVFPSGALQTSSYGEIALVVDNVEVIEARRNWESAHGMIALRAPANFAELEHRHGFEPVAGVITELGSSDVVLDQAYAYLDWDPLGDLSYALDTRGAAHVQLQMVSDQADVAPNNSRVLPIEYVELAGAGAGG